MTQSGDLTGPEESLARAVHAVYGVPPEDFVATRKDWVARLRSEGLRDVAKEVAALRKPSVAAAAVNALVRADDPVVARLRDVGERMRHAQSALDVAAMTALRAERDELLNAWVTAARTHAPGGTLTAPVEAEVRDTAVAALADVAASEVVTSGNLTRALGYSGFGEVDVADAVARTSTGVVLTRIEGGGGADVEADDAPTAAEEETGDEQPEEADEESLEAEAEAEAETEAEDDGPEEGEEREVDEVPPGTGGESAPGTAERTAELEMELDEAEKVVAAARAARKEAATADAEAEDEVTVAEEQVAQAERLLSAARKHLDKAQSRRAAAEKALATADEELRTSRRLRDATRAALEEAEDA